MVRNTDSPDCGTGSQPPHLQHTTPFRRSHCSSLLLRSTKPARNTGLCLRRTLPSLIISSRPTSTQALHNHPLNISVFKCKSTHLSNLLIKLIHARLQILLSLAAQPIELGLRLPGLLLHALVGGVDAGARLFAELLGLGLDVGAGDFGVLLGFFGAAGDVLLDLEGF